MRYFVAMCNKCNHHRPLSTSKIESYSFKCYRCGTINRLKLAKEIGLNVKAMEVDSMASACRVAMKYNGTEEQTKELFETYRTP